MRKLVSAGALLFVLGVACLSRPAAAVAPCDCGFCATHSTFKCADLLHQTGRVPILYLCSDYTALFCP
jgi:hypothetical protein